jgi:hypothetical protein
MTSLFGVSIFEKYTILSLQKNLKNGHPGLGMGCDQGCQCACFTDIKWL